MRKSSVAAAAIASACVVLASTSAKAGLFSNVSGLDGYSTVYSYEMPAYGAQLDYTGVPYAKDLSAAFANGSFTRVGYYMELQANSPGAPVQYVYAEFDAAGFTNNASQLGIPTGVKFQQNVSNMRVVSNVSGVVNGSNIATGNIEFWPSNYAAAKDPSSPANASDSLFDFGDSGASTSPGHGSFQIHNYGAGQTLMAYNHWGTAGNGSGNTAVQGEIGLGNAPSGHPDWTFTDNSASYQVRNLQIVVNAKPTPELTLHSGVPSNIVANVGAAATRNYQLVYQSSLPSAGAFTAANYSVDHSAEVAPGSFGRIAYYLELTDGSGNNKWVWVSAKAFTADASKIGVPILASGAEFQGSLSDVDIIASSNSGLSTGTNLDTANIEFWPTNYTGTNALGAALPGASNSTYDFGDEITPGNYGSMQIFNDGQTVFAFNHWGGQSGTNDLGIGTYGGSYPDYTFAANAGGYTVHNLYVLVLAPEPTSLALLGLGIVGLMRRRRRA